MVKVKLLNDTARRQRLDTGGEQGSIPLLPAYSKPQAEQFGSHYAYVEEGSSLKCQVSLPSKS